MPGCWWKSPHQQDDRAPLYAPQPGSAVACAYRKHRDYAANLNKMLFSQTPTPTTLPLPLLDAATTVARDICNPICVFGVCVCVDCGALACVWRSGVMVVGVACARACVRVKLGTLAARTRASGQAHTLDGVQTSTM